MTGEERTIHHINKRVYNPQKLILLPEANHLPSAAGVHLGNKVQAAVLYSIQSLDQWLFKGHSCPTKAKNPMGKCLAGFTHSLSFIFTAHNESLRDTHIQSKDRTVRS